MFLFVSRQPPLRPSRLQNVVATQRQRRRGRRSNAAAAAGAQSAADTLRDANQGADGRPPRQLRQDAFRGEAPHDHAHHAGLSRGE